MNEQAGLVLCCVKVMIIWTICVSRLKERMWQSYSKQSVKADMVNDRWIREQSQWHIDMVYGKWILVASNAYVQYLCCQIYKWC